MLSDRLSGVELCPIKSPPQKTSAGLGLPVLLIP
ncbi:hypothetical protein EC840_101618 [Rahnella sp. JUb53]|nr:hypothetical protein EC840_101618 [Rahnella sp. JUb53]